MNTRFPVFVALGLGVLFSTAILAADWPQWRGPNRDNKVAGFTAPATWPKELTQKWKVNVGVGEASPALVGDKIYAFGRQGGDEVTTCLDAATGKVLWENKYEALEVKGAPSPHPGPRSSPAVAEGKVCTFGVGGVLSCLDAATGKEAWRIDSKSWPQFYASFSPLIVEGKCIIHLGGQGKPGELVAYDLATGQEKWKWTGDGPAYGSPVLMTVDGTKQLVTVTEKLIVGISVADGKLLWQLPFLVGRWNMATPVVEGQTVICAGEALKIEKQGDTFDAKRLWKGQVPSNYNTPVLKDGMLFGLAGSGRGATNLFCVNAQTGELLWTDKTTRGECGTVLDAGSVLLALTSDTELIAFQPSDKGYVELAKYKVADKPGIDGPWAYPIIAGNRVFVKDRDSLALWTIE